MMLQMIPANEIGNVLSSKSEKIQEKHDGQSVMNYRIDRANGTRITWM